MFQGLFGKNSPAREIYTEVRKAWHGYGLEIYYNDAVARNFPWELLYDTDSKVFLVHQFASFARRQMSAAPRAVKVRAATERLNVLLVIARPYGAQDVAYRTVARPVMELLSEPGVGERIRVEVLRPPTFENFKAAVSLRREDGSALFDVVHFDGHGGFGIDAQQLQGGRLDSFKGPHGKLVFETEAGEEDGRDTAALREVIGQHGVPLVLLNACRSGMEALEDEKAKTLLAALLTALDADAEAIKEKLADQKQQIASVTGMLLDAGAHGVLGMGYVVYAKAAALFMAGFYKKLLAGGTAAEAVSAARMKLVGEPRRPTRFGDVELQDWQVPVYHEVVPVQLFRTTSGSGLNLQPKPDDPTPWQEYLPSPPRFGFLGRDRELLGIERALLRSGVAGVTLIGLGGTGKTSLAVGAARWLLDTNAPQVKGGLFLHAFLPQDSEGHATRPTLDSFIRTAGQQLLADEEQRQEFGRYNAKDQRAILRDYLRETAGLLILDNAEAMRGLGEEPALLDESERREWQEFLQKVCAPHGRTRLLLTSRRAEEWLNLNLEAVDVGGLDDEAADELAVSVVRAVMGTVAFDAKRQDEAWEKAFNELLDVLGGHPLALQIVLRHLKDRDPAAVKSAFEAGAAWIDQKLESGASDRERLLAACINYGFGTLSPRAQTLLPFLAYWREWVDVDYLEIISAKDDAPARLRGATQDEWTQVLLEAESTGLVTRVGQSEYFRLHPLLPWFLRVNLSGAADAPLLEVAFRRFGAGLAGAISQAFEQGGNAEAAVHAFAMHRANLLHALALARPAHELEEIATLFECLYQLLKHSGQKAQAAQLREELDSEWKPADAVDPATREGQFWLDLEMQMAKELTGLRDFAGAEQVYQDIAATMAETGDPATVFHDLGVVAHERRDFSKAEEWYFKSLDIRLQQGNEHGAATIYYELGFTAWEQREFDKAEEWLSKSLEICLRLGDLFNAANAYQHLSIVAQEQHDMGKAEEWLLKSLEIKLRLQDEQSLASTYHELGSVAQQREDFVEAEKWHFNSLEVKLRQGDEYGAANTYRQLGVIAKDQGDLAKAEEWLQKSLKINVRVGDNLRAGAAYLSLGDITSLQDNRETCIIYYLQALRSFQVSNDPHNAQVTLHNLRVAHQSGVITRTLLEDAWQNEMGMPLPPDVAEFVCVEGSKPGAPETPELTEEGRRAIRQMLAAGMKTDEILSTIEQAQGQSFAPEVKDWLRQEIVKVGNEGDSA